MERKFYGVYASNGLGIYTSYGKLMNDTTYMRKEHLKSFKSKEDAEDFATDGFIKLNGVDALSETIGHMDYMRLNYFYFFKRSARSVYFN